MRKKCVVILALFAGLLAAEPATAELGLRFDEGMWRLEVSGAKGLYSGRRSRQNDTQFVAELEYEVPASPRATLGLRLLPLLVYDQNDRNHDTIWGAGAGIGLRYYLQRDTYRGLYGEADGAIIGHSGKIDGNSGSFNFLVGFGVGYQFNNNWHTAIKWRHISNASTASRNAGANTIGLAIGYRF